MDNNDKLLDAQKKHGCQILYIIEGSAYPSVERKIGRMPYKCLQGKLDSLLFRNDIKIIWTKDCEHTAKRLAGLSITFTKMAKDGVFGEFKESIVDGGIEMENNKNEVIKPKHEINLNQVHLKMLTKLTGVSYKTAISALQKYTVEQLLTGQTDQITCYNLVYIDSGFRMGNKGTKLHAISALLHNLPLIQQKILACINGITINTAMCILETVSFADIVLGIFDNNIIADVQRTEKRKVGKSIEARIRLTFPSCTQTNNTSIL
jgi:hypothetical protein